MDFIEEFERLHREFKDDVVEGADVRYSAWVAGLMTVLRKGKLPSGKVSPYLRFKTAAEEARKKASDPMYAPKKSLVEQWVRVLNAAESFLSGASHGHGRWGGRKRKVNLPGDGGAQVVSKVFEENGEIKVRFQDSSRTLALEDFLKKCDHNTIYVLSLEGLGGMRMSPAQHRGAAIFLAASPPGAIPDAAELAEVHLGRAGTRLGPPDELEEMLAELKSEGSKTRLVKEFEELKTASKKCKERKASARMIGKWRKFIEANGDTELLRNNRSFIDGELERLDKIANPPEPVKVPGLAVKADSFESKTGKVDIRYTFKERNASVDWASRRFYFGSDNWADYAIDNFWGGEITVQTNSRGLSASGGGFVFWKPRLVGDFQVELDLNVTTQGNQFVMFHMTDNGGYSFVNKLDLSAYAGWALQNRIQVDATSGTGLFSSYFQWPPKTTSIKAIDGYRLFPKRWYTLRIAKKGTRISLEVGVKGRRTEKSLSLVDDRYKEGRFGICLVKSGMVVTNVRISGTMDLNWLEKAQAGIPDDGDLPGTPQ
jgi:hypothetical protein